MLVYRVREHNKTNQTIKWEKKEKEKEKEKRKQGRNKRQVVFWRMWYKKIGMERKGKAARGTPFVLFQKRNRCLLHGQNNTKKITNCSCCTDKATRRRGRRYRHEAGGEGKKVTNKKNRKKQKQKARQQVITAVTFALLPLNSANKQSRN